MPHQNVLNCMEAIDKYQTNYTADKWHGDTAILEEVTTAYKVLTANQREEITAYLTAKREAIYPLAKALAEVKSVAGRGLIGAVAVPVLDAYLAGGTTLGRAALVSLCGGLGFATTGMRGGMDPSQDNADYYKIRPLNDIYRSLKKIPLPLQENNVDTNISAETLRHRRLG